MLKPETFQKWLVEMRSAGLIKSDAQASELLDVHRNTVQNIKNDGTDKMAKVIALAMRALLHRMEPYE